MNLIEASFSCFTKKEATMRLIVTTLLASATVFAMTASKEYIEGLTNFLDQKIYPISGSFYMYDFNHNGKIEKNDWLYVDSATHRPFRLLGIMPTEQNPFGWDPFTSIPSQLDTTKVSGYFVFINYPEDTRLFGNNAFSWVYLPANTSSVYKLMGATPDNSFDYLDEDGDGKPDPLSNLGYLLQNGAVKFFKREGGSSADQNSSQTSSSQNSSQSISAPSPIQLPYTCTNIVDPSPYLPTAKKSKISSGYRGDVVYDCTFKTYPEGWGLKKTPFTIINVIKEEHYDIHSLDESGNEVHLFGTTYYDYANAEVRYSATKNSPWGTYTYECSATYPKALPATFTQNQEYELGELLQDWGQDISQAIQTDCPAEFLTIYSNGSDATNPLNVSSTFVENYAIVDENGDTHFVSIKTESEISK
jgi:hypothetical protein